MGLTAEHLGGRKLATHLTEIINSIIQNGKVPEIMKGGRITPVGCKGKYHTIPGNHRGITVTSLTGNILESVLQKPIDEALGK